MAISTNELTTIAQGIAHAQSHMNRFECFKAVFNDGAHQLVLRLKAGDKLPAIETILLESGKD